MDKNAKNNQAAGNDESWLRLIPENGPLLIGYMGADRRHRYVNAAYANWFLKKPEELINKTLKELAYDPASYAAVEPYETRALSGERVDFVIRLPVPIEGGIDSFQCHFIPHLDPKTGQVLGMVSIAQSMTQHERLKNEFQDSERRFRAITNTIPQLMWTAKSNGEVDYVNQRCMDYTGKTEKPFGQAWIDSLHPEDKLPTINSWAASIETGVEFKHEYRMRGVDGKYRWFFGHAVPIRTNENEIQYWIGTATDIEEKHRQAEELNQAKTAAEDANNAKSAFLANISHELRTPLNAVLGFSSLLSSDTLSEKDRKQFIEAIDRNGKMLSRIIDDLLDMTRIEAGRVIVDKVTFSPGDLLGDIIKLFKEKAEEKKIGLNLFIDPSVPKNVMSDPVRLRQIMINIIGNAVKFTERGEVSVKLTAQPESSGSVELFFEVKDTGCGFTEAEYRQLFVPFFQADTSNSRRYGGAGLGLSISRRLATALGGDVKVTQYGVDQGATFLVTISAQMPQFRSKTDFGNVDDELEVNEEALQGLHFLVVDDAVDNQFLTKYILESKGAKVDVANSGVEALDMLEKIPYDLVLLDIQMPVMDGYQTLTILRQRGFQMPVVAITAHAMKEDIINTMSAGFAHHLTKPLNLDELIRVVSMLA